MEKGVVLRFEIHKILYNVYKLNKYFDINRLNKKSYNQQDIGFINNVCLNSMRYHIHTKKIILQYSKKKPKLNEFLLLTSAITQIVFLDFKDYAVTNCSVEIAKKLNIYHGYINSLLKKVILNKKNLNKIEIKYNELPSWFVKITNNLSDDNKKIFLSNYYKEPSLHIVFKKDKDILNFEKKINKTSKLSGFVEEKFIIKNLKSYKKGNWWVQDFSSSFPLINIAENKLKGKIIDLCAAPGGKTFQIVNKGKDVVANDANRNRIKIFESNLKRLNFKVKIYNYDLMEQKINEKFNFVILDAPCSAIGTIRKNPEIFFKKKKIELKNLLIMQEKMLQKASILLHEKGMLLYMVCSFLDVETFAQIEKFLKKNKNFSLHKFDLSLNKSEYNNLIKNDCMYTLPTDFKGFNIDGYFAAYLKKT